MDIKTEDETTKKLQKELDELYEKLDLRDAILIWINYRRKTVNRIVEIEKELEKRSNI